MNFGSQAAKPEEFGEPSETEVSEQPYTNVIRGKFYRQHRIYPVKSGSASSGCGIVLRQVIAFFIL
jgi:hypothetical protein